MEGGKRLKIDSHQHFWIYNENEYGWIGDNEWKLKRDFLPHHLEAILANNDFEGSIVVQARQTLEETNWLLELAEQYDFIKGVVGWLDLCSDKVETELERLSKYSFLKGIRHIIHDEQDERFMLRREFKNGISKLQQFGLTYDLLLFPKHLPYALELVEEFQNQPFVLDHLSKPFIKDATITPWENNIQKLAKFSNVHCKLSGMVTEADWDNWKQDDFTPYLDVIFREFGKERVMIGSDWPVCTLSRDYDTVMKIVLDYIKDFPKEDQDLILGGNCKRFYHL